MTPHRPSPRPFSRGRSPRWRRDLPVQLAVIAAGGAYVLNSAILGRLFSADERRRLAIEHARRLVDLERALHLFNEHALYRLAHTDRLVGLAANGIYLFLHLPLIVLIAVWLYSRQRPLFVLMRDAMLISGLIALACEYYPVAPPHLVPDLGFTNLAASRLYNAVEPKAGFDVYGALPSIHVGWALLMGLCLCWRGPRLIGPLAGAALPIAMAFAVAATGNHYHLDSITGVLAALVGLWLSRWHSHAITAAPVDGR
ncbi:MAG TPA: phosphatase PAP2 family protein [Dehalococcoidia bacterium]|nr:phosphatase PAP2 family protein [Dehalococcoidia bacterium]